MSLLSQKGFAHLLPLFIVVEAIGIVSFILLTSTAPFKNAQTNAIFPKSNSFAIENKQDFGVNDHLMWQGISSTTADLDRMKQDGILTVRFDLDWVNLEPNTKGTYNQTYLQTLDQTMAAIAQRGMIPVVTFLQSPAWALDSSCTDIASGLCPPTNMQDYADTFAFLANRYKTSNSNVVWEVWNEPNGQPFWKTTTGPNAAQYTLMLQKAYTSIKAVAPQATVVGGVIVFNDQNYLKAMYASGAKGYFDALDIHPYSLSHGPSDVSDPFYTFKGAIEGMEGIMAQNGEPGKPIYITEMGWDTATITDPNLRASYYQQAAQLVKTYPYVVNIDPYTFKTFSADSTTATAALVPAGPAGSPTPAWTAYILAVSQLIEGDLDGNGKVDIFDYNILITNYGKSGIGIQGDLDDNGKVDIFDYNTLIGNYGK